MVNVTSAGAQSWEFRCDLDGERVARRPAFCQLLHQNVEGLGACRILAVGKEEVDESFAQCLGTGAPGVVKQSVGVGSHHVEHIEAEYELCFQQQHDFLFVDGDEIDIREGGVGVGILLMYAEQSLWFRQIGCLQTLHDAIGPIVGNMLCLNGAVDEEGEPVAGVASFDEALAFGEFVESYLGMCHHFHQVGMTHALKEGELQQLVV